MRKGGVLVNNNMLSLPVAGYPWAGAFAAAPGACLPMGTLASLSSAEHPVLARPRAATSVLAQRRDQASAQVKPVFGQPSTTTMYTHVIRAAADGGSQTGSLPAWDPV